MRHEVLFSGFGGQGIILSAVILGRAAAIYDKKYAVQTQVYGPEARGGASMSAVVIDDEAILYPEVSNPDTYVIMSQPGYDKYGAGAREDAFLIYDRDLVSVTLISESVRESTDAINTSATNSTEIVAEMQGIGEAMDNNNRVTSQLTDSTKQFVNL